MARCFFYVVDRDFGFAPNPFHGFCTLATCKPRIRKGAELGDWVVGMGGARLKATGRCVYAMKVTDSTSFNDYWADPRYLDKRPVRNGSSTMMVGDNIYRREEETGVWLQADSHHSNHDGSPNMQNVSRDTGVDRVLISKYFFYFGKAAPLVPPPILSDMGYKNCRGYRVFSAEDASEFLEWLGAQFGGSLNLVSADPYDFDSSGKRYSAQDNKVS